MKILLVEDEDLKRNEIIAFLKDSAPFCFLDLAKSLQSGLKSILHNQYDLVVLDMTMHTYDVSIDEEGGRPQAFAGREILRQMSRRKIDTPVVVLSQFDRFGEANNLITITELDSELKKNHPSIYIGAISFSSKREGWKNSLLKIINTLTHTRDNV